MVPRSVGRYSVDVVVAHGEPALVDERRELPVAAVQVPDARQDAIDGDQHLVGQVDVLVVEGQPAGDGDRSGPDVGRVPQRALLIDLPLALDRS